MTEIPFKPGPWIENLKDAFRRNNPDEMIKINAETSLPASELFIVYSRLMDSALDTQWTT